MRYVDRRRGARRREGHRQAAAQVAEKYALWLAIVRQSGPQGLRPIKAFHDEKLPGKLAHLRSSRLSLQWRVIYRVNARVVTVYVERITPHDYRP